MPWEELPPATTESGARKTVAREGIMRPVVSEVNACGEPPFEGRLLATRSCAIG